MEAAEAEAGSYVKTALPRMQHPISAPQVIVTSSGPPAIVQGHKQYPSLGGDAEKQVHEYDGVKQWICSSMIGP